MCRAGACVLGATFTGSFTQNQDGEAFCPAWNTFRASLTGTYNTITVSGSRNVTGYTCTGATANAICQALRAGTAVTHSCGGRDWNIGQCGAGITLAVGINTPCTCGVFPATVRPCINVGNSNWGGLDSETCGGPSQTLSVRCD